MYSRIAILAVAVATLIVLSFTTTGAQTPPLDKPALTAELDQPYTGTGARINLDQNYTIEHVYPGSPASTAGVLTGDRILAVNGTELEGKTAHEVLSLFSVGGAGAEVVLKVSRQDVQEPLTFSIIVGTVIPDRVLLYWNDVEGADSYDLWEWEDAWVHLDTIAAKDFDGSFQILGRKRGIKYYYTVRAFTDAGEKSDWADFVSVTYLTLEAANPTPTPIPSPTPIPDTCVIIHTHTNTPPRLQAGTQSAFIERFGEDPENRAIGLARFFASRNHIEISYIVTTSDDHRITIWELWQGCEFAGYQIYRIDDNDQVIPD